MLSYYYFLFILKIRDLYLVLIADKMQGEASPHRLFSAAQSVYVAAL